MKAAFRRIADVDAALEKSRKSLEAADANLQLGDTDTAIGRAYYAAYHAAVAALMALGHAPKTHDGVHTLFSQEFIKTRLLPERDGSTLRLAYRLRQRADYDYHSHLQPEQTAELIRDVEDLVLHIQALLPAHPPS